MNIIKKIWTKFTATDFYKTYKEEMIIIPLIFLVFYVLNNFLVNKFPTGQFFDYLSEIETIFSKIVKFFVALWVAHLALRSSFPKVYKFFHDKFYHKFDELTEDKKTNYTVAFIITLIIAAAIVFA